MVTRTTPSARPASRTVTVRPARFARLIPRPRRVTVNRPPRIDFGGWTTSERRGTQRATGGGGGAVAFADSETAAAGPLLGTESVAAYVPGVPGANSTRTVHEEPDPSSVCEHPSWAIRNPAPDRPTAPACRASVPPEVTENVRAWPTDPAVAVPRSWEAAGLRTACGPDQFASTVTLPPSRCVTAMSVQPSPSKSATATLSGEPPTAIGGCAVEVPSPAPSSTDTA